MSTGIQAVAVMTALLLGGCDETSDDGPADAMGSTGEADTSAGDDGPEDPSTTPDGGTSAATSSDPPPAGDSSGAAEESSGGAETSTTGDGTSGTGSPEVEFHEEFIWIADFVREKCVACHDMGQNGNLLLPSVDMTNDEVRLALDGGVATTGLKFIEPFDPAQSQVYIMITNAAGEQFPAETTDRVADWINLGAPYYAE